ncbi:MAG: permease-like cell division protein FtsX [Myxococcota bacterium]|nr:permease-like cell division protein FtsX [Myxococcota bacterium]
MSHIVRHILRRSVRSLWENLYLNSVASGVIAAALLLFGVYLTVQYNLNSIVDTWSRDVHISAYFHPDTSEDRRFEAKNQIAARPGVASVRYVSEADARDWLTERVEGLEPVLIDLGEGILPASLEVTLTAEAARPAMVATFAEELAGPEFTDIDYGREWVERFNAFLSLLKALGVILGMLILVSAMFLVTNTVYLIVYNRKDELEVARLVGASDRYITAPFLFEGLVQGFIGGMLATVGLWGVHRILVLRLQEALQLEVAGELAFIPPAYVALLALSGVILGVTAAIIAVKRFLRGVA